jgi:dienelactone hydrolase
MLSGRPLACFVALAAGCGPTSTGPRRPLASLPTPPAAGAQDVWATDPGTQTESSRWFLTLAGEPVTLALDGDLAGTHLAGSITAGDGAVDPVDNVAWDAVTGVLDFRRVTSGVAQWVHARAVEGVLTGRVGYGALGQDPPGDLAAYADHVVGWNEVYFSTDVVPRVFDLEVGDDRARLRLDRDAGGMIVGRFKVYADEADGNAAEEVEDDVAVQSWDGQTLAFSRDVAGATQTFGVTVDGAALAGTMMSSDGSPATGVTGTRVELLAYGFAGRDAAARADWQTRTRRQLAHLMMADDPDPLSLSVDRAPVTLTPASDDVAADRDDDADRWPADYAVDELHLTATLSDPYGGPALARALHGYLTTPSGSAPAGGWPAIVVLNGHDGSARGTLDPSDPLYWYGDAWARRGYVVIALDIGHRPLADRSALYHDYAAGDAPDDGNGTHPAIRAEAIDSDWVEDGERAWDVARAIDYLATLDDVDTARLAVSGLSMGGEVATFAAALDPRVAAVVPAGFVPDLTVMALNGNHPCWRWLFGDPLDWISVSDLHALVAPRPLVVETGLADATFSRLAPPFVDGKEVARRSRAAFADAPDAFALYLHPGGHEYRFGDVLLQSGAAALDVTVPAVDGPRTPGDLGWAADGTTESLGGTLADLVAGFLSGP